MCFIIAAYTGPCIVVVHSEIGRFCQTGGKMIRKMDLKITVHSFDNERVERRRQGGKGQPGGCELNSHAQGVPGAVPSRRRMNQPQGKKF